MRPPIEYAYLHGYASGPTSFKGQQLASVWSARGATLHIPDLNRPSLERLTYTGMLEAFDDFVASRPPETRWRLIGSSMGGLIASRWAELNSERIDRLVLLAPGFDLPNHWRQQLGPDGVDEWQQRGYVENPDPNATPSQIHWGLMADALTFPPFPPVACPTLLLHGRHDETVPIAGSRRYADRHPKVELVELDDDHQLLATLDEVEAHTARFLLEAAR